MYVTIQKKKNLLLLKNNLLHTSVKQVHCLVYVLYAEWDKALLLYDLFWSQTAKIYIGAF